MSKAGPIILIDDDYEDVEIFKLVLKELAVPNEFIHFDTCMKAMDYLLTTTQKPMVIFCDVNLPVQNGIEFKQNIDYTPKLRKKSIPFVFYSTSVDQATVDKAYLELTVQGFFQKASNMEEIKKTLKMILEYWLMCRHPNSK
jgi:two-component SAPR family response regulator